MITILFIIFMSAIISAIRSLQLLEQNRFITRNQMTKFGTAYVFWLFIIESYCKNSVMLMTAMTMLPPILAILCNLILRLRAQKFVREEMTYIIDCMILKMKSGRSLRASILELRAQATGIRAQILEELNSFVAFSQQIQRQKISNPELLAAFAEIRVADHQPHHALKRLEVLRERLKTVADFRRRSGQVTQQARAQAYVLTGIYFAVLFFVIHSFGWSANRNTYLVSLGLFAVGLFWMFQIGRKLKWQL